MSGTQDILAIEVKADWELRKTAAYSTSNAYLGQTQAEVAFLAGYGRTWQALRVGSLLIVCGTPTQESHGLPSSRHEVWTRLLQDCRTLQRPLRCPVMFLRS